eukprot:g389.t1
MSRLVCLIPLALIVLIASKTTFANSDKPSRELQQRRRREESECRLARVPYVSSIRDARGNHHCGALVISEQAVLTSAACVDRRLTTNLPANPRVHLGGTNSDEPIQVRRAVGIFVHDSWNGNKEDGYDLAVLKLNEETCVRPVRFLGRRYSEQDTFLAVGFGRTGATGVFSSDNLQGANLTYIPRRICNERFQLTNRVGWKHLCFQSTANGASICTGDEGSPIVHAPFSPEYEDSLIAIASYTEGDCDESGSVAVAMNVRKFRRWIIRTLNSTEFEEAK